VVFLPAVHSSLLWRAGCAGVQVALKHLKHILLLLLLLWRAGWH
jgi:hypothetical protein